MRVLFCLVLLIAIFGSNAAQASGDAYRYRMIAAAANRHGISVSLAIKVVKIESDFDCAAEGSAGELGPLQIKPATARIIGYQGSISALQSCGAGLEWGMKHLAMAIRAGGVWKHNQGLWAKIKSANAAAYERKVMDVVLADFNSPIGNKAAKAKIEFASKNSGEGILFRNRLHMSQNRVAGNQNGKRQKSTDDAPHPGQEYDANEYEERVHLQSATQDAWGDELRLGSDDKQVNEGQQHCLQYIVKSQQPDENEDHGENHRRDIGYKVAHECGDAPHHRIGNSEQQNNGGGRCANPKIDERRGAQIRRQTRFDIRYDFQYCQTRSAIGEG